MEIRQAINLYLTAKAYADAEFKVKFENPNKNLDECVMFIQAEMLKRVTADEKKNKVGCVIPSDDEIFSLAETYYLDDDIKVDGTAFNNVKILSASATYFTDEEKAKMREEAIKEFKEKAVKTPKETTKAKETPKETTKETPKQKTAVTATLKPKVTKKDDEPHKDVAQQLSLSLF